MIDVTPQLPLPEPKHSPLEVQACRREGMLVCNGDTVEGETGVSMDDLVAIMTRLSRETEKHGIDKLFKAADTAERFMTDANPLLDRAEKVAEEFAPLLKSANDEQAVASLKKLVDGASALADDVHDITGDKNTQHSIKKIAEAVSRLVDDA